MAADPFDSLLGLEDEFYQEGYDTGLADGEHAGIVEGKVFGIEKGYEKALELGKLQGRALVWQLRQQNNSQSAGPNQSPLLKYFESSKISLNTRVTKHIETLLNSSSEKDIRDENSDDAVAEFDDRIARSQAKAKVIAAIVGEPVNLASPSDGSVGIEESTGLKARH